MQKYKIAMANSRNSKFWKNIDITFKEFAERLKKVERTSETQGEYKNLTKTEQDRLKDVGGYVAGYLKDGKRNSANLQYRSMLTLDVDFAETSFIKLVEKSFNYAFIVHSTRKYEEEKPRYRLIIPFNRNCGSDEYGAVARYIANEIGINMFDDTTYQPNRLMYFPSVSQDQEYIFKCDLDRQSINVDEILSKYDDWKDTSTWYTSSRTGAIIQNEVKKQKDPLEKSGVVGAFCKAYDIYQAINTFLNEVYEECQVESRYTYLHGSTYGGAVVYGDGKFLYSNHATDPASGKLCNAFDLVRLHKFGGLDEDIKDNMPTNRLPSYVEMLNFARNDNEVKKLIQKERQEEFLKDFEDVGVREIESNNLDWVTKLEIDKRGQILNTIDNIKIVLQNDPNLKNKIIFDEFKHRTLIKSKNSWNDSKKPREWSEFDDAHLRHYLEKVYNIKSRPQIEDAFTSVLDENKVHPVQEYLKSLQWDGIERVENLFIDYLGAEDNEYTRAVTKLTLIGAVKRVMEPGAKFDTVLVLAGGQGLGKSTIVKKLGVDWGNDSIDTFKGKDTYEQLQGSWIIELAEMTLTSRTELNTIKQFLTKSEDNFRMAYAKRSKSFVRQCIFIGTTNTYDFLKDPTGDRRYLPLDVGRIKPTKNVFKDLTREEIDKIWSEVCYLYEQGDLEYIEDEELLEMAKAEQKAHREENPIQGMIENYLNTPVPNNWNKMILSERLRYARDYAIGSPNIPKETVKKTKVCIMEIWVEVLQGAPKDLDRKKSNEIKNSILKIGGWEWSKKALHFGGDYGKQKGFIRV